MATIVTDAWEIDIPADVLDLDAFRRWAHSGRFPEHGRIWWLAGKVWADMGQEPLFTHNLVKTQITAVLTQFVDESNLGVLFGDGILLSNFQADISGTPDAVFLAATTLASDRVRLIEGAESGFVEVQGCPDMVLEVVSRSSTRKDQVVLRRSYWEAGVREYWLADARADSPRLDILRHTARGYSAVRPQDGWARSPVFGRPFRLTQTTGVGGYPKYRLEVRRRTRRGVQFFLPPILPLRYHQRQSAATRRPPSGDRRPFTGRHTMLAPVRTRRRLGVERLEARDVPAADVLASLTDTVTTPRQPDWLPMQVRTTADVGPDRALLSVETSSSAGSDFRPGRLALMAGEGGRASPLRFAAGPGFALREVHGGLFFARVAGAGASTGGYNLTVRLAGDVTGDGRVDAADLDGIRVLYGTRTGDPAYNLAADVNRNGIIGMGDVTLALRNLGRSADVGTPTVDDLMLASSDTLGLTRGGVRATVNPAIVPRISLVIPAINSGTPIDVQAFSWGVAATGGGVPVKADLTVQKVTDESSPALFLATVKGNPIGQASLFVGRRGGNATTPPRLKWELENVFITSYQINGTGGGGTELNEAVTLSFTKIKFSFWSTLPNGKPGPEFTATWDFATGGGS